MSVSTRERAVIRSIQDSVNQHGWPPSQREIAAACGLSSPASTNATLRLLEAKGLIRMIPGAPRALAITESGMAALTEEV